jgi:uncharacterized protein YndB with AHSA1/START domain
MALPEPHRVGRVEHETLTFERQLKAPREAVFEAFSDSIARAKWAAPSPTSVVIYDTENFIENGEDEYRCGSKDDPSIHGRIHYLEIVENSRIVSSETLTMNGQRLSASMTTMELSSVGSMTMLSQTTHVASFIGASMIDGFKQGNNASLDNLVKYVDNRNAT